MKFHPYSEAWRLLKGVEFDDLTADIKEHGLREKIWLYEGQILDGRNRYLACQKAALEPKYRTYKGSDPISFVISLNRHRRHDNENEIAFAAARIATMRQGQRTDLASGEARSQIDAAEELGTSRSSVQRAKKVIERGSKALQQAAESGAVTLSKAASVVALPKSEQLKAATQKAPKRDPDEPERPDDADEGAALESAERELAESIGKVMRADDKSAAMHDEIKRQAAEISVLKISRDGFMNGKAEITRLLKQRDREVARLKKELAAKDAEIEKLNERIAIMGEPA